METRKATDANNTCFCLISANCLPYAHANKQDEYVILRRTDSYTRCSKFLVYETQKGEYTSRQDSRLADKSAVHTADTRFLLILHKLFFSNVKVVV